MEHSFFVYSRVSYITDQYHIVYIISENLVGKRKFSQKVSKVSKFLSSFIFNLKKIFSPILVIQVSLSG